MKSSSSKRIGQNWRIKGVIGLEFVWMVPTFKQIPSLPGLRLTQCDPLAISIVGDYEYGSILMRQILLVYQVPSIYGVDGVE